MNAAAEKPLLKQRSGNETALVPIAVCSAGSRASDAQAAEIAGAISERVILTRIRPPLGSTSDATLHQAVEAKTDQDCEALVARLRRNGATVEVEHVMGGYAPSISSVVRRRSANIVIIPDDIGDPQNGVLPSDAEQIAESVPVPTILLRDGKTLRYWIEHQCELRIFVAYDFSATADEALLWAGALRSRGDCKITIGYAAYPPQESWRLGISDYAQLIDPSSSLRVTLEQELRETARDLIPTAEVEVRLTSSWGRPEEELSEMADEAHADLVLIGSHQRHGFGRFWLGSVSRALLRRTHRNVMIVPSASCEQRRPGAIQTVRRVLVTTDLSELGNRAVGHAYSLLAAGGTVCVMTVVAPDTRSLDQRFRSHEVPDNSGTHELRRLVPSSAEALDIATVTQVIEGDDIASAICQTAERFGAEIVCIASHGRSGLTKKLLGSVTQEVLSRSRRPVLVVRPPEN